LGLVGLSIWVWSASGLSAGMVLAGSFDSIRMIKMIAAIRMITIDFLAFISSLFFCTGLCQFSEYNLYVGVLPGSYLHNWSSNSSMQTF